MILQALTRYYEDLLSRGEIAAPGWAPAKISLALYINENGELTQIVPTMVEGTKGKKTVMQPQLMVLPAAVKRTVSIASNFLWDNSAYLLGIDQKGKPERSRECFAAAAKLHHAVLDSVDSPNARAILAFFDTWEPERTAEHPALIRQLDDVTVAGIYEHYTGHFIYMTPDYYGNALHADGEPNAYLLNFTSDDTDTCNAIFEKLLDMSGVATTSRMRDTQDTYMHSMERVDFVVVIIILAAAALAMVVLFNLSNINITERQRELATIKLLGFYDGEVSAYVYRENIVLTLFGILLGCFMGHWLHIYLVRSTEIDLMMFGRQTAPSAYVYAAILTALFSLLVNVLAHFRMKKIDMVESLKSAE